MDLNKVKRVYFIGIGGIGMSALARYFHERKVAVSGYDRTASVLTRQLEAEGIQIHYEEGLAFMDKAADVVVYTPAIPKDNAVLNYYREAGYTVMKRSDMLQEITKGLFCITVAGTHGKTTISTLIAHILRHSGYGCSAFLGGISVNYNTNFWSSENKVAVIEADEYDRSFLKLKPDIAVLTAMDPDHLDIYGTREEMQKAFIGYTRNIAPEGVLIVKSGLPADNELRARHKLRYSLQNVSADIYGSNILMKAGGYEFDVVLKEGVIDKVQLHTGGMHNVENTIAAVAAVQQLGISRAKIKAAIAAFKGVKRRFEFIVKNERIIYIDDYAHHPEELRALIQGAMALFSDRPCKVIFQPHLFSRTRDMADEFAHSLDAATEVVLLPIYPARELPMEGVSSELIARKMENAAVKLMNKQEALEWAGNNQTGLLITAGAGDIDQLVEPIKKILSAG